MDRPSISTAARSRCCEQHDRSISYHEINGLSMPPVIGNRRVIGAWSVVRYSAPHISARVAAAQTHGRASYGQGLTALSLRHSKRSGLPLEIARRCVEAVAVSTRKRYENPAA